jgi:hypothetical protein
MSKISKKGLMMSAVYETSNFKNIKKVWHDGRKTWSGISKYDGRTEFFSSLQDAKTTGMY